MDLEINGQAAYAYTGGKPFDRALPCVIFIHGAENDHTVWALQSRWFAHHEYSVLAVDLPGHGRSSGTALASIEALADWIGSLIEIVGAGGTAGCSLVGHSMGSLTALECAARFPERIACIALVGTAVPMPVSDSLLGAARDKEAKAISMINSWSHSALGTMGGNRVPGIWLLGASKRLMERQKPGVLHTDLAACNAYMHGLEAAASLQCPTLIISGSRDLMTSPKVAAKLASVIPTSCKPQYITLQGAGHALMGEEPDAVLDALRDFIPKP
jgi:pimeloyl-ACP methyl ester carboxylesterase